MRTITLLTFALVLFLNQAGAAEVAVGDLDVSLISSGWRTAQVDRSVAGLPLGIGGRAFSHGVGVHAPSAGCIYLDGHADFFRASVGVNDGGHNEKGSVEFVVKGDGKLLWRSGIMRGGEKAKELTVPLAGVRQFEISVGDGGDGMDSDHGDWANAVVSYSGAKPSFRMPDKTSESDSLYPSREKLVRSPGGTPYFVDPARGDDSWDGTTKEKSWKSIARINALNLAPGDKVNIAPGVHQATFKPSGAGTAENPVVIQFLPGRHEFAVETAIRRPYFVSNSCDDPKNPKPIGILVENARHLRLQGAGVSGPQKTEIVYCGRMIEIINDHSEGISYSGLIFDLKRPTVSEFRVLSVETSSAVIQIAEGSDYAIDGGKLIWTGDTGSGGFMVQEGIPEEGRCWRGGGKGFVAGGCVTAEKIEDLGDRKLRLTWNGTNHGLQKGHQFQFRVTKRDSVGVHNTRSKDIVFRDCDFHALTGMGFVSQFTENITYQRVNVVPPAGSIRTCPAWGDIFQFSNCRGEILVDSCRLSGMQDDAINCHGTHLRIIDKVSDNQLLVRFMHGQTYGFAAYAAGDEVAVISHSNLRELPGNPRRKVTAVEQKTERDWVLTLDGPAPAFGKDDVLDNVTWYPNLTARNNHVSMDPVRGFLLTTRGKVLIENNTFHRPAMPGILVEDDAEGWFESGPVRDMVIRNNRFIGCGIQINPQTRSSKPEETVHENILVENNFFDGGGIGARSVKGLTVVNNRSVGGNVPVNTRACVGVKVENNTNKANE